MAKGGRKRVFADHAMTANERMRRKDDKLASIDEQMKEGFRNINIERKEFAKKSLQNFVDTYLMGVLFEDSPSDKMRYVLDLMLESLNESVPVQLMLPRGSGKTTATEALLLYLLLYGFRKFVVIVSANARAATNILRDIWRVIQDTDTPLAQDFPEVCLPYSLTGGATKRRQLFNGASTDLQHNATELVFPRLKNGEGGEYPTSGSVLTVRGITSGIRGLKKGATRPDTILLDDLQSSSTASNPEQVEKIHQLINADIMNLSSKSKIGVICCATPICDGDLTYKIKKDVNWRTLEFPYVMAFPEDLNKGDKSLWNEYYRLYDVESIERRKHTDSLEFYKAHFEEMNKGSELFHNRFSEKDGQISGIQAAMDKRHLIGDRAFFAEYQMTPVQVLFSLPITPEIVASRISSLNELEIPKQDVQYICASTDINASKYLTTVVMVFMRNGSSIVTWHKFRKCHIPANIPPEDYTKRLYDLLGQHGQELKSLGIPIQGWSIDGNGTAWDAVTSFCKNSMTICGIPACSFVGKASHLFRDHLRSRLKESINNTLLCGDDDERKVRGSGRKWVYHNSDLYHEKVQKGFLTEVGNLGSISWYKGGDHTKWSIQVCGEKLIDKIERQDDTTEYRWKQNGENHDALDAIGQCLATYANQGFATTETGRTSMSVNKRFAKKKVKIV